MIGCMKRGKKMKERILVVIACVLSCVVIFSGIIAYKEYRQTNSDIQVSPSNTGEKLEENTSAEEETTTQTSEETTLEAEKTEKDNSETTTTARKPSKDKTTAQSTETVETTTKETTTEENNVESTTVESTIEESTTVESTTEEPTTEKIYPVLAESKADMVRLINDLTASASQGSYTLTRVCYAEDEFVASDMEKLDEIIQNINPDATFNSAINGYLGVGTTTVTVENGGPTTDIKEEYLLKATSLTVDDVRTWRQHENKIIVNLVNSRSSVAFEHVTNDFITVNTINEFMSEYTTEYTMNGAMMGYGPLSLEVTIDDGKLTNLKINHSVYADVEFSPYNRMEGTYITETTYSDIVYN